jgi:hypothetical protein
MGLLHRIQGLYHPLISTDSLRSVSGLKILSSGGGRSG